MKYQDYEAIINLMEKPDIQTAPDLWRRYWQCIKLLAQEVPAYESEGQSYLRRPYRREEYLDIAVMPEKCHDCGVSFGQLHVPTCDMERCPRCGGQAISCKCLLPYPVEIDDDDDETEAMDED